MRSVVELISERIVGLVAEHSQDEIVMGIARDVAKTYVEVSCVRDQKLDPDTLDIDASAREVLHAAAVEIKHHGRRETHEAYGFLSHLIFYREFQRIYAGIDKFVRIGKIIYERSN